MRGYGVAITLGMAFGTALLTGAAANASPVDDAWPYPDFQLPGVATVSNLTQNGALSEGVFNYSLYPASGEFSTHYSDFNLPLFFDVTHQQVFDSSVSVPPDGTTIDQVNALYTPGVVDFVPNISNTYISDPVAGVADQFMFQPSLILPIFSFRNTFISDSAGIQDVVTIYNQSFTLFDFPSASAGDAAPSLVTLLDSP